MLKAADYFTWANNVPMAMPTALAFVAQGLADIIIATLFEWKWSRRGAP